MFTVPGYNNGPLQVFTEGAGDDAPAVEHGRGGCADLDDGPVSNEGEGDIPIRQGTVDNEMVVAVHQNADQVATSQTSMNPELIVIHEHPEWQKPLFAALERRGVRYAAYDVKRNAFDPARLPQARVYFNQASPSAYVRGNTRAVPLALALMRSLELGGGRVLNGSRAFALELSKSAQAGLMRQLGIDHPRTMAFNDAEAVLDLWDAGWPALLKPEQGGSGARMYLLQSPEELLLLLRE